MKHVRSAPVTTLLWTWLSFISLGACGGDHSPAQGDAGVDAAARIELTCDAQTCPPIPIANHPFDGNHACINGAVQPCPARGFWDPSLALDPGSGTLWLAHTSGTALLLDPGPPVAIATTNNLMLARSTDRGRTFEHVSEIILAKPFTDSKGVRGTLEREVSSLVRRADGSWEILWFEYFSPTGADRREFVLSRRIASSPEGLASASDEIYLGGSLPSILGSPLVNLSAQFPALSDCGTFTEPALLEHGGTTYLALNCIAISGAAVNPPAFRMVLLKREVDTWNYVGVLLDVGDAEALGGKDLTQANLSQTRSGDVVLVATLADETQSPHHRGCYAFRVTDISRAAIKRDAAGAPDWSVHIQSPSDHLGAGLCTYDAASETGIVITRFDLDQTGLQGELLSTGIHP